MKFDIRNAILAMLRTAACSDFILIIALGLSGNWYGLAIALVAMLAITFVLGGLSESTESCDDDDYYDYLLGDCDFE